MVFNLLQLDQLFHTHLTLIRKCTKFIYASNTLQILVIAENLATFGTKFFDQR